MSALLPHSRGVESTCPGQMQPGTGASTMLPGKLLPPQTGWEPGCDWLVAPGRGRLGQSPPGLQNVTRPGVAAVHR